jgi:Fic family protein
LPPEPVETAGQAVRQARWLEGLREKYRKRFARKPKALALVDQLFVNPYITVARAAEILEVSNPTARQTVALPQKESLLREISGRAWGRLYLAEPILKAIESPPEPE